MDRRNVSRFALIVLCSILSNVVARGYSDPNRQQVAGNNDDFYNTVEFGSGGGYFPYDDYDNDPLDPYHLDEMSSGDRAPGSQKRSRPHPPAWPGFDHSASEGSESKPTAAAQSGNRLGRAAMNLLIKEEKELSNLDQNIQQMKESLTKIRNEELQLRREIVELNVVHPKSKNKIKNNKRVWRGMRQKKGQKQSLKQLHDQKMRNKKHEKMKNKGPNSAHHAQYRINQIMGPRKEKRNDIWNLRN